MGRAHCGVVRLAGPTIMRICPSCEVVDAMAADTAERSSGEQIQGPRHIIQVRAWLLMRGRAGLAGRTLMRVRDIVITVH